MFMRMVLIVLGVLIASQAMLFGQHLHDLVTNGVSPSPWSYGGGITAIVIVTWILAIGATIFTAICTIWMVINISKPRAIYFSRGDIVAQAVLLIVGSYAFGAFVAPFAAYGNDLKLWFFQYPQSLPLWLLLAPSILGLINVVREMGQATADYEARHGSSQLDEVKAAISTLEKQLPRNLPTVESVKDLQTSINTIALALGWYQDNGELKAPKTSIHQKLIKVLEVNGIVFDEKTKDWQLSAGTAAQHFEALKKVVEDLNANLNNRMGGVFSTLKQHGEALATVNESVNKIVPRTGPTPVHQEGGPSLKAAG